MFTGRKHVPAVPSRVRRQLLLAVAALLLFSALPVHASTLLVKPYQVCSGIVPGTECANAGRELFESAGDKIWAQAGIDIYFLAWSAITGPADLSADLATSYLSSWNPSIPSIALLFFHTLNGACGAGAWGCAYINAGVTFIADQTFADGRMDTIYHEIGHNLGLPHTDADSFADTTWNDPYNLMAPGGTRLAPTSATDITPDGKALDRLSPQQIAAVQSSPLLLDFQAVPEPRSWLLVSTLALFPLLRRKKRRA